MRFRFSGHESFPCRYTWLPKAYKAINENPLLFLDDNQAMVKLGVGKNMVKSIRFWVQVFGIAANNENTKGLAITPFGHSVFHTDGLDPYLEDIRTLWLLHWKVSSITDDPLFAWYFLLNQWPEPDFSKTEVVKAFGLESDRMERPLSDFTKEQHFEIFLHTYLPVKLRRRGEVSEENLDCPLTELRLIIPSGERLSGELAKKEPLYSFRQDIKPDITGQLLSYCIYDFWSKNFPLEATLSFRAIASLPGSVGQVFRLTDADLRTRLEMILHESTGIFEFQASAAVPRLVNHLRFDQNAEAQLLTSIYGTESNIYFATQPKPNDAYENV